MKKAKLFFEVSLDYQTKNFKPLSELGEHKYDNKSKKYIWRFPVKNMREVLAIHGRPIVFEKNEGDIVSSYMHNVKQQIKMGPSQGTGLIRVQIHPTKPNYFVVTTVRERQPQNTNVSFDTVQSLWKVISQQPKDKKILTHTVAQNYCRELGIVDFNTYKEDKFNWKYFSGSRKYYLVFYAAIKVLVHFGVIEHVVQASKSGIKRITDKWDIQTELIYNE